MAVRTKYLFDERGYVCGQEDEEYSEGQIEDFEIEYYENKDNRIVFRLVKFDGNYTHVLMREGLQVILPMGQEEFYKQYERITAVTVSKMGFEEYNGKITIVYRIKTPYGFNDANKQYNGQFLLQVTLQDIIENYGLDVIKLKKGDPEWVDE